jgi:hypothetical protein
MSEYQYYEFQAIDRPLTEREIAELRAYSTRVQITSASFINDYSWGLSRGMKMHGWSATLMRSSGTESGMTGGRTVAALLRLGIRHRRRVSLLDCPLADKSGFPDQQVAGKGGFPAPAASRHLKPDWTTLEMQESPQPIPAVRGRSQGSFATLEPC